MFSLEYTNDNHLNNQIISNQIDCSIIQQPTNQFILRAYGTSAHRHKDCKCTGASHDDVIKWKQFPRYWPFVRGIHWSPVNSFHKGQWRGALVFSLICTTRTNGCVMNQNTGDLRHHHHLKWRTCNKTVIVTSAIIMLTLLWKRIVFVELNRIHLQNCIPL